ncbi:hypothetical protein [Stenotrophomonas phage BUCT608]|nr:hypothetical protein [Stenotrophomonas phage BUCT608]QYC97623.1 hypothetical protein [Stenotrophomonas phage BUCT608]
MSLPSFKRQFAVFIRSYVGDADYYDTTVYETDHEHHALFVRDLATALFDFDEYSDDPDGDLRTIMDTLFKNHRNAMLDVIFSRNPSDWLRQQAKNDPVEIERLQFEEFIRNVIGHCGEYSDCQKFRSVDAIKLFKINSVERVN